MKNLSILYPIRNYSLFAYLILLGYATYLVFPFFIEETSWSSLILLIAIHLFVYTLVFYLTIKKTMKLHWMISLIIIFSVLRPFLSYYEEHVPLFSMFSYTLYLLFLFSQLYLPKKEESMQH